MIHWSDENQKWDDLRISLQMNICKRCSCCCVYLNESLIFLSAILNPFGLPTGPQSQSPTNNLFAARAMQEEKNRRIPINQMQGAPGITPGYAQPTLVSTTTLPAPLMPGAGWPMASGVGYQQQPIMQPQSYPQSKNPFQWLMSDLQWSVERQRCLSKIQTRNNDTQKTHWSFVKLYLLD